MKYAVAITTIFPPTAAVRAYADREDCSLYVAGDRKTPDGWDLPGCRFLSVAAQNAMQLELAHLLPWNHYCRKMLGYLAAIRDGAEVIVDTDDDNLPKAEWGFPGFAGEFERIGTPEGFTNVYRAFTGQHIWPRGFPLDRILAKESLPVVEPVAPCDIGIWQGLADEDPDVDAIYRLTSNEPCCFENRPPLVLEAGVVCPFNSQNTAFRKEVFPLLYLPAFVTFRFTDILRGLVAQPILWAAGYRLGFLGATVVQERNPHDYLRDFESEIPCYLHPERVVQIVNGVVDSQTPVAGNLVRAYEALVREKLVQEQELPLLAAWLDDLRGD